MVKKGLKGNKMLLAGIYGYLTLPVLIFLAGWCRWYIAVPAVLAAGVSFLCCIREHGQESLGEGVWELLKGQGKKCLIILLMVMCWVGLSGVGGYVWQNSDHECRNAIFDLLVENDWPVIDTVMVEGIPQERGLVYYIGFWLPAAVVGKIFGLHAGYAAQYIWAVLGILLFYGMICVWRRKVVIWPLWIVIFFSGADVLGTLLNSEDTLQIFGTAHLERWPRHYQFSSMTTQLFWVFNQAIPAWLASALIFLWERPKNMVFTWSLIMLTSTLPFAGLLPFVVYFMISRGDWKKNQKVGQLIENAWGNWGSIQNILGGGVVSIVNLIYLTGNVSVGSRSFLAPLLSASQSGVSGWRAAGLVLVLVLLLAAVWGVITLFLHGKGRYVIKTAKCLFAAGAVGMGLYVLLDSRAGSTSFYKLMFLFSFYMAEAGIYLVCLKSKVTDSALYWITAVWLLVIPLIVVGNSIDFCMRASIPALVLVMLWCIDSMDTRNRTLMTWILIGVFLTGSVTALHEIKRTYVNTRDGYVIESVGKEGILMPGNFSGEVQGVFWEWIAR